MKWEKIAERGQDFLKNCLLYEALIENYVKEFDMHYTDTLTVRKGMSFTHYFDNRTSGKIAEFVLDKVKKNPKFMEEMHEKAKEHYGNLLNFCYGLKDLKKKSKHELLELIREYFRLYKAPYPYFLITAEARILEKQKTPLAEKTINQMAKLRLYGRASFNKTHEEAYPLFKTIADRFGITVKELKFLAPHEIKHLLKGKKLQIKELVKSRNKCFFIYTKGVFKLTENATVIIHDDEIAEIKANQIKGQGYYLGKHKGRVRLIKTSKDMRKVEQGDVIVTQMTTTDLLTAGLRRAGAIITDEGGITCHAAIVSRELKIPTIIGTKIATKFFKEGDISEVDSKKGIARLIERK